MSHKINTTLGFSSLFFSALCLFLCLGYGSCATSVDDTHRLTIQGHRGARGLMPENTIPAFIKAIECGVDVLELDVVVSADSQIVISHEPWMSDKFCSFPDGKPVQSSDSVWIFRLPYDSVAQYDCGKRRHPLFPEQQSLPAAKPLLRDLVRAVRLYCSQKQIPEPDYNIETKIEPGWDSLLTPDAQVFAELLYAECKSLGILRKTTFQSFDGRTLYALRAINPLLTTALLIENKPISLEFYLARLGYTPEIISPDYKLVNKSWIDEAHAKGMKVVVWTVNDSAEAAQLIRMGVDGIITDYPDRVRH